MQFPQTSQWEKVLLQGSRSYKLLRFTYLLSYNHVRYGKGVVEGIVEGTDADVSMQSRISSYFNDPTPGRWPAAYFRVPSLQVGTPPEVSREFLLTENYEWLIRAAGSDNTALVLTTMYLNYSKEADEQISP